MSETTKKPLLLTWYPIIMIIILGFTSTAVDAYRLTQLEASVTTKVSKATYSNAGLCSKAVAF